MSINYFKLAFKKVRENDEEIHRGFGFKHLSDVTNFYVHVNNQSYTGKTTLCQQIGEAVIMATDILNKICVKNDNEMDDVLYEQEEDRQIVLISHLDPDFKKLYVITADSIRLVTDGFSPRLAFYDKSGVIVSEDLVHGHLFLYFVGQLIFDYVFYEDIQDVVLKFIADSNAKTFVHVCEDFYQRHKYDESDEFVYEDIDLKQFYNYISLGDKLAIIKANEERQKEDNAMPINTFSFNHDVDLIPTLGDEFVIPNQLRSVANAIVSGDSLATLFYGPAGTGKTMSCKIIARDTKLPILATINCTENLDEFILGKYIPIDGKIIFKESEVTKAIREGGAVVFEEINMAKPQYLAFLNSLLDDNGFVRLDNGEKVLRHKDFRFFATMNYGYYGTRELNQALYNRFNVICELEKLSDEAITRMLCARVPECRTFIPNMLKVYHQIQNKIMKEELDIVISPRNLEAWAKMAKYEGYIKAADKTILPICKTDKVLENTMMSIIKLYKW